MLDRPNGLDGVDGLRARPRRAGFPSWRTGPRVAFVSSFPPRRCGIASFTADLARSLKRALPSAHVGVIAIDPSWERMDRQPPYAAGVDEVLSVTLEDPDSYTAAAAWAERQGYEVLCVQHEYGIFGGDHGEYVVTHLLRATRLPVVTTLHTVLRRPNEKQRQLLVELAARSRTVVVQARSALDLLERVYGIDRARVLIIPHGTPDFPAIPSAEAKARFGFGERPVLLTYGLLSPGKGIEQAIQALPEIARRRPDVLYVVAGQTHPNVRKISGEAYRESLIRMAAELGVGSNVQFIDRYLDIEDLGWLLAAADVYVLPYPNEDQAVSGTLSYALAAGKAVVSTPFRYARELIGPGRGLLCRFGDPSSLAAEVLRVLESEDLRRTLEHRARAFGQSMSWEIVGARYGRLFEWVVGSSREEPAVPDASSAAWAAKMGTPRGVPLSGDWSQAHSQPGR